MTGTLNVLHVIRPEPAGSLGGADLHVVDLCAAQNETGLCRASILALDASTDFLQRAHQRNLEVHDPTTWRQPRYRRLAQLPHSLGVDIVHSHGYEADYLAACMPLLTTAWRRVPTIMTCHGLIAPDLRHRVMSRLNLYAMRRSSALITVADHSTRLLQRVLPSKPIYTIPNGVTPPLTTPTPQEVQAARRELGATNDQVLIGYVGRLSPEKRPDLFLSTAADLTRQFDHLRFAVIGGGQMSSALRPSATHLNNRVVFAGLRHDIDAVYQALDVLVLPSDIEGTSRVVLEAQQRGIPVIASAVGAIPTLIEHATTGLLVRPDQTDETAAAIVRLISEPDLVAQIATQARTTSRARTHEAMAAAVRVVYTRVVERHDHARSATVGNFTDYNGRDQPGQSPHHGSSRTYSGK